MDRERGQATIIAPGRNCWRTARANRIAWLIDAAAYFSAFREAVKRARRSIFILAWDIDSRAVLVPDGSPDGWPATVGELLNRVVSQRRGLHAYVLDWDYPVLYQTDREIATAYPDRAGLGDECIKVHSKLMVVDDRFVEVGSANLSNRSMGYDTECDLAVEAVEPRAARAIGLLLDRLLGEHLGVSPEQVAQAVQERGSLVRAIEALRGNPSTLQPLDPDAGPQEDALILDPAVVDPERPIDPDRLAALLVPRRSRHGAARRVVTVAALLLVVAGLAAAWHWAPLRGLLDTPSLAGYIHALSRSSFAPLLVVGAYVVASLTAIPITLVILATTAPLPAGSTWHRATPSV